MKIDAVENYRYLGVDVGKVDEDGKEIQDSTNTEWKSTRTPNGIWWAKYISKEQQLTAATHNAAIKSIVMNRSKTWRIMNAYKRSEAMEEIDAFRRS